MKRILMSIIILLLIILLVISMINGINIAKYRISSISDIKSLNQKLDEEIQQVDLLNSSTYANELNKLNTAINNLELKKSEYIDLVNTKSISEIEAATKEEKYEIEFLWTSLGFKAKANNLWLKANVTNPSNGLSGQYDINITVRGGYTEIEEFIKSIENDVNLGFKIEEFIMLPYQSEEEKEDSNSSNDAKEKEPTGEILEARFTIRNIVINLINFIDDTAYESNETVDGTDTQNGEASENTEENTSNGEAE